MKRIYIMRSYILVQSEKINLINNTLITILAEYLTIQLSNYNIFFQKIFQMIFLMMKILYI